MKIYVSGDVTDEEALKSMGILNPKEAELVRDEDTLKTAMRDWLLDTTGMVPPPMTVIGPRSSTEPSNETPTSTAPETPPKEPQQ